MKLRRRRERPAWPRDEKVQLEFTKVKASRAMYVGEGSPEVILVEMVTTDNQTIEFELSLALARDLIEQVSASYSAIYPPIKTPRPFYGT